MEQKKETAYIENFKKRRENPMCYDCSSTTPSSRETPLKLDQQYQLQLLQVLSAIYPASLDHRAFSKDMTNEEMLSFMANLVALGEQGLVDTGIRSGGEYSEMSGLPCITRQGMDFLAAVERS